MLIKDLDLNKIFTSISIDEDLFNLEKIRTYITDDINTIKFRVDIIEDLLNNPDICGCLEEMLHLINELENYGSNFYLVNQDLMRVVNRLGELNLFLKCIQKLKQSFEEVISMIKSEGLSKLYDKIISIYESDEFQNLLKELPEMLKGFKKISSITIGINLDSQFNPVEAILVSVNEERYKSGSIIEKLIETKHDPYTGISPLQPIGSGHSANIFKQAIISSVNNVLSTIIKPIIPTIKKYAKVNAEFIIALKPDICFYLSAVRFANIMKACGLPVCKPEVLPKDNRICRLTGMYNLSLALHKRNEKPETYISNSIADNDVDLQITDTFIY